jgi:hypothetical protein
MKETSSRKEQRQDANFLRRLVYSLLSPAEDGLEKTSFLPRLSNEARLSEAVDIKAVLGAMKAGKSIKTNVH